LLAQGVDANGATEGGQTPLIRAAISGHTEIAQILLAAGADPRSKDSRGLSAIDWAERRGFAELNQMLKDVAPRLNTARPPDKAKEHIAPPEPPESTSPIRQAPEEPPHTFERSTHLNADAEKSRRWVAGLRQRLGEEETRRVEAQNSSSLVRQNSVSDSTPVRSDSNEFHSDYLKEEEERRVAEQSAPRPRTARPSAPEQVAPPEPRESAPPIKQAPEEPAHTFERSTQVDADSEKSRRWVAGFTQRSGEEETQRVETQNSSSLGRQNSVSDSTPVRSDSNEFRSDYIKEEEERRLADQSARAKLRLESQIILEQSRERIETKLAGKGSEEPPGIVREIPEEQPLTSQLNASTESGAVPNPTITPEPPPSATESSAAEAVKRCPKCNATYNSELLAYCALDATPLVDADSIPVAIASPPPEVSNRTMLLVLIGVVLLGSASLTLLITSFFAPAEPVSTPVVEIAAPAPPPPETNKPVVGGDLAGMEVDLPLPNYPQNARDQGIKGDITVRVRVNSRGRVISVRGGRGEGQLIRSALAAARKATFSPEKLAGKTARGTITYSFK